MSNTIIHYVSLGFPDNVLIRESEFMNQDYVYSKCPVHTHKQNRVFIGLSPIDFSLRVIRKSDTLNRIICDDTNLITWDDEHVNSPKPVIQLKFPKFMFYTNEDDVWFDFYDHPMTALKNNFVAVRGWFNLSNWSRTSSLGITIVDETEGMMKCTCHINDKLLEYKNGDFYKIELPTDLKIFDEDELRVHIELNDDRQFGKFFQKVRRKDENGNDMGETTIVL